VVCLGQTAFIVVVLFTPRTPEEAVGWSTTTINDRRRVPAISSRAASLRLLNSSMSAAQERAWVVIARCSYRRERWNIRTNVSYYCVNWCGALFGPTCRSEELDLQPRRLVQDPNAICGSDSIPF
jgi:hypothetical protein